MKVLRGSVSSYSKLEQAKLLPPLPEVVAELLPLSALAMAVFVILVVAVAASVARLPLAASVLAEVDVDPYAAVDLVLDVVFEVAVDAAVFVAIESVDAVAAMELVDASLAVAAAAVVGVVVAPFLWEWRS